jgi:hypothetical protein
MTRTERAAAVERSRELRRIAQAAFDTNTCPSCGSPVAVNTALTGWIQCVAYPCDAFRKPEYRHLPKCHWQGFTE